jgi:hypothetical protein
LLCSPWQVWKFYHDRRQEAQSGCKLELESGSAANACQSLDNLEKLVYEVAYTGDAEQLYHQLKVSHATAHVCHFRPAAGL